MINNKKLIIPLLNFGDVGDFYMLYLFKRKKDQPENEIDNHQSVRTIKTYCVDSIEYLEKRWVIDIDNTDFRYKTVIIQLINSLAPEGDKIIAEIPTKSGLHLITKPFNTTEFVKYLSLSTDVIPDIQKKNPTLLYLPNSLLRKKN